MKYFILLHPLPPSLTYSLTLVPCTECAVQPRAGQTPRPHVGATPFPPPKGAPTSGHPTTKTGTATGGQHQAHCALPPHSPASSQTTLPASPCHCLLGWERGGVRFSPPLGCCQPTPQAWEGVPPTNCLGHALAPSFRPCSRCTWAGEDQGEGRGSLAAPTLSQPPCAFLSLSSPRSRPYPTRMPLCSVSAVATMGYSRAAVGGGEAMGSSSPSVNRRRKGGGPPGFQGGWGQQPDRMPPLPSSHHI